MRFRALIEQWQGVFLIVVGCSSSVWLAATKQLNLYIHPRYILFTAIMAGLGLLMCLFSLRRYVKTAAIKNNVSSSLVGAVCVLAFLILLVVSPATLTTATVKQRGINSGIGAAMKPSNAVPLFGSGDYSSFTVKDWASLLTQTSDQSFFAGKTANITGFISPDPDDPQNVFLVSRFVLTCCAVDARPIGVPVYAPDWQSSHKADGWVRVAGAFVRNRSAKSQQHIALQPATITDVAQPREPYVY